MSPGDGSCQKFTKLCLHYFVEVIQSKLWPLVQVIDGTFSA